MQPGNHITYERVRSTHVDVYYNVTLTLIDLIHKIKKQASQSSESIEAAQWNDPPVICG